MSDSPDEIHCCDDAASADFGEALCEGHHLWAVTAAPGPDAAGHVFSITRTFLIQWMGGQQFLGAENEVTQQCCCLLSFRHFGLNLKVPPRL